MDILILAAGHGKRMNDLTKTTPKPLLRFKEKNLLSYALELAEAISVKDIHVNVHYHADQIISFINANFPHVKISNESQQILNTAISRRESVPRRVASNVVCSAYMTSITVA